jgi:hypothetical protein
MLKILLIIAIFLEINPSHPETLSILAEIVTSCRKLSTFQSHDLTVYRPELQKPHAEGRR